MGLVSFGRGACVAGLANPTGVGLWLGADTSRYVAFVKPRLWFGRALGLSSDAITELDRPIFVFDLPMACDGDGNCIGETIVASTPRYKPDGFMVSESNTPVYLDCNNWLGDGSVGGMADTADTRSLISFAVVIGYQ